MLKKTHRFTRREFSLLRPRMKKFRTGDFLFFYAPFKRTSKLAAVVSKKVDKRAVKRNAWRRRVYRLIGAELMANQQPMAIVCLYKGSGIPDNDDALKLAWQEFKTYAERKKLLKFVTHE